ncbi:Chromo domain-containing protein [Gossypium australe]|uniref:Chromo domain-containing protein n=1 Tax=Gossypium australe TaxID=47621 RepID=A0A5B6WR60_9ROSI|nr:Chromo domain-containing protein [Gossypium australe]
MMCSTSLRSDSIVLTHLILYLLRRLRRDRIEEELVLRSKTIPLVKVLCRNHGSKEATWESDDLI